MDCPAEFCTPFFQIQLFRCHFDKTDRWSDEHITKWYGPGRRRHYGTIIEVGRNRMPEAHKDLVRLTIDYPYLFLVKNRIKTAFFIDMMSICPVF